jgi:hypothetical protein
VGGIPLIRGFGTHRFGERGHGTLASFAVTLVLPRRAALQWRGREKDGTQGHHEPRGRADDAGDADAVGHAAAGASAAHSRSGDLHRRQHRARRDASLPRDCRETLRIDGRLEGEVHCEKSVIIGEGATVRAAIEADEVAISGEVKGDISARRKITLDRTARVIGERRARSSRAAS